MDTKKIALVIIIALFMLCPVTARAYSDEDTQSMAIDSGANDFQSEYLEKEEISGDKNINIFQKLIDIMSDTLKGNGKTLIKSFGLIMSMLLICCVMNSLKLESLAMDTAIGYISVLVLSGVTYSVLYNLFIYVISSMQSLSIVMSSLMPVMASLHAFGGTVTASAASSSALTVFLSALSLICTNVVLPLLRIAFVLCISGAMPGSINLSSVANLVKNTATTLMAFIFTALGFVLYIQTIVAAAGDGFIIRSVRFASGVFVPVIGSMLGEASRTVLASVSMIKGTVGSVGVVLILAAVLPPFIVTILYKLMLLLCAMIAKALGCERESAFLYDLGGILGVLLALTAGAGIVCIIAMAVFIKVGVNI